MNGNKNSLAPERRAEKFILVRAFFLCLCLSIAAFVSAQPKLFVATVDISGNKRTKTAVILREMSIAAGDSVLADSVQALIAQNYTRLYNLNMFTDIDVRADFPAVGQVQFSVHLKEQWFLIPQADVQLADRNVNVWWNEQQHDLSRINLGVYVQHKNLTGNFDKLSLALHAGYTQQVAVTYTRPYVDKAHKHGFSTSVGYSRSKEIAYKTEFDKLQFVHDDDRFLYRNFFANAAWIYRPAYRSRHIAGLGFSRTGAGDTVLLLNPQLFEKNARHLSYLELSYRFEYNGTDNWNYPRKGLKIVASSSLKQGLEGMTRQLAGNIELGTFQRLGNRFLAAQIVRARWSVPGEQPYFLRAGLGYRSAVVRGYEYYVIDAPAFALLRLNLKYEAVRKGIEKLPFKYLPRLPLWIYPKVFCDVGVAGGKPQYNNTLPGSLLCSAGLGVDIITAYDLKLRIEFALNALGENGIYLHANSE